MNNKTNKMKAAVKSKGFWLILMLFLNSIIFGQANIVLDPSTNSVVSGNSFSVTVKVITSAEVDAVEVHLDFDKNYLEVTNIEKPSSAIFSLPSDDISPTEIPTINNSGQIDYAAGIQNSFIAENFDFLTITFKAINGPVASSAISFVNRSATKLTEAVRSGVTVPGTKTGATVTITSSITAEACFTDNTTANFTEGTLINTYVSETTDGEVILKPTVGAEFNVLLPTAEWNSYPWTGGTSTVSNGALIVDGARYNSEPETTTFGPGRSLEFVATFGAQAFQHIGFGEGTDGIDNNGIYASPIRFWAMFSTNQSSTELFARTNSESISIGIGYIGIAHLYRINWLADGTFQYYIDDVLVHTSTVTILTEMRPAISDYQSGGAPVTVDWIRMSPYSLSGSFESQVYDAGESKGWGAANWNVDAPTNTTLSISVRTGNTATPDATWSDWKSLTASGDQVMQNGQYIQYKADMTTTDPNVTPALLNISFDCTENLPLPVKLTSFKATVAGHDVNLNWSTSTEINNKGFNVQRSVDGRTWQTIGFVNGAGNSTATNHYAYSDKNLEDGRYYYRLMQVDFDEQFEYSPVETAVILNANSYLLKQNVPNPLNESTTIQFIIPVKSKTTLSVFDTHGRLIKMLVNEILPAGTHQAIMKKESLSAGIYYYKLQTETFSAIKKMIIQ